MKKKLLCAALWAARCGLSVLYALLKCLPTRDQVCFFSRQSDSLTIDFRLLQQRLRQVAPELRIVTICHRFRGRRDGALRFAWDQLRSLYWLATSRVCVVDAYWPVVSLLRHKKSLRVIQIWHSVGKIKRSGYQTLGLPGGRDAAVARVLRMHRGYDDIICGGAAWDPYYCQSFDVGPEKLRHYGLPRLDYLLSSGDSRAELARRYPRLGDRTVVLYAPTYRKYPCPQPTELTRLFDPEKYELICRFHPNQTFLPGQEPVPNGYEGEDTFTLMRCCDYLISDYSSLPLEAAVLSKRTVYYMYDHERYVRENGLNFDPMEMLPECSFLEPEGVFRLIDGGHYPDEALADYRRRYLPEELGRSTEKIVDLIVQTKRKDESRVLETV